MATNTLFVNFNGLTVKFDQTLPATTAIFSFCIFIEVILFPSIAQPFQSLNEMLKMLYPASQIASSAISTPNKGGRLCYTCRFADNLECAKF